MQFPILLEPLRTADGTRAYRVEIPAFPGVTAQTESIETAVIAAKLLVIAELRQLHAAGRTAPAIHEYLPQLDEHLKTKNRLLHLVAVPTYRCQNGSDSWHFCRNCEGWPEENFVERVDVDGELCNECRALDARHACQV